MKTTILYAAGMIIICTSVVEARSLKITNKGQGPVKVTQVDIRGNKDLFGSPTNQPERLLGTINQKDTRMRAIPSSGYFEWYNITNNSFILRFQYHGGDEVFKREILEGENNIVIEVSSDKGVKQVQ